MKLLLSPRVLFFIGFAIIVTTNVVVLSGAASNRSGDRDSQIILTERELRLPYRYQVNEENSGLALRLSWSALGKSEENSDYIDRRSPAWFNTEKLEELGFDITGDLSRTDDTARYQRPLPREVYIVLEMEGEPYNTAVKRAEVAFKKMDELFKANPEDTMLRGKFEMAENRLKNMHNTESRLFAVDAGLDRKKLRIQYGDPARFIIARGQVKPMYRGDRQKTEAVGYVMKLSVEKIHVPLNHRKVFDDVLAKEKSKYTDFEHPRYEVELAYGSRLEPWILSVEYLDKQPDYKR